MFKKDKQLSETVSNAAPLRPIIPPHEPTARDILVAERERKLTELDRLNQEIVALDLDIAWVDRCPQAESVIKRLKTNPALRF